jgi:predicted  nucleic acid-binding Zn-ribbon protein
MARDLDTVVSLHQTLTALDEARQRLAGIPDWMRELHDEHSARLAEIAVLDASAAEATAERRAAEGVIADAQEKLKRYQQQINAVTTQREYGALLQEIDTVKQQISGSEESGFAAMERFEKLQRELAETRESFRELDERYGRELAKWEAEKPAVAAQAEELERRAAELRREVPRPLLGQFNRIRERHGGTALAPIRAIDRPSRGPRAWHCGACNYRVRPQVVVEIRNRGSLVQCDSCKRILFLEDEAGEG